MVKRSHYREASWIWLACLQLLEMDFIATLFCKQGLNSVKNASLIAKQDINHQDIRANNIHDIFKKRFDNPKRAIKFFLKWIWTVWGVSHLGNLHKPCN